MTRIIRPAGLLPMAVAAFAAGVAPVARSADLPCGAAPTRACVLDLILKAPALKGDRARWFSFVELLAQSGRAKAARGVAGRRLADAVKTRALLLIDGIDAARRGDVAQAKAISARFENKADRLFVAVALWRQGKADAADGLLGAAGNAGLRFPFLLYKARLLAVAGKADLAVTEFGRALALLSKPERADSADYFWDFAPLIPVGQRAAVLPRLAALAPDQTRMFGAVTHGLAQTLVDLGAKQQAAAILDPIRVAWFGAPPASVKPKALKLSDVERMAYLYGRLDETAALDHLVRGVAARDRFMLGVALARAGDVAAIDKMIAGESDPFFKRRLHALAAPEFSRAGHADVTLRLLRAFAKLAGPPGKNPDAVEGWAHVASMAKQPLALLARIGSAAKRREAIGALAKQFARDLAFGHMRALLASPAAAAMKLAYYDFATAPWVCRMAEHAALTGKRAAARAVVETWYASRVARDGVKRASDSGEPLDCLMAGGDVAGALGILMSPSMPERHRLERLLQVARMLPPQ